MMQEIKVLKYENSTEINKDNPKMEAKEINSNDVLSVFQGIFCNDCFPGNRKAPMWLDLQKLKDAIYASNSGQRLHKDSFLDSDTNVTRYGSAITKIKKIYMPYLLVADNPNKFLKLALETRKACLKGKRLSMFRPNGLEKVISIKNKDDSDSDVTNPLDRFYIGLDQVAQFLNFCVMLRQIPTKNGQEIKNIDQIEKLSFDKSVLKEFINQYDQEKTSLENTIGKENNIEGYKTKLKGLRAKYDNYCRAVINGKNGNGSYDECISFTKWISQSGDFVEGYIRMWDNSPWIGVYKNDEDKIIDREDVAGKEVKYGYHEGGGITDKNELTKLLKLDAILQAGKAIDKFIDTKAVDESTLNWFEQWWNSSWIANKLGWFFKEKEESVKLTSNKFISRLDEHENKKTALNETTEKNLNDI